MGSLLWAVKETAVFAAINTWRMSSKQGIMIRSELLICYSASGKCSVSGRSQLKASLIQSAGDRPSVTPTEGPRRPVGGEKRPLALWLTLTPAPAPCSSVSLPPHPPPPRRTSQLLLITGAAVPRGHLWGGGCHGHYQSALDKPTFFFSKARIRPVNTLSFIPQTHLGLNL